MPFVIAAPCVADFSCLEVCPVDCISPGPESAEFDVAEQLYIDPDACIDCAACVKACPVDAIYKKELLPEKWRHYADVNADYFANAQRSSHQVEPAA